MNTTELTQLYEMKASTWEMNDKIVAMETCARELERNIRELNEWSVIVGRMAELLELKAEKVRALEAERERLLETPQPQLRRSARIAARR